MSASPSFSSTTETVAIQEQHPGVLGTLGLNASQFGGQLFNFSIVLFVMWYFVYRPLVKKMDERSQTIEDGLAFSKQAALDVQRAQEEKERILREARAEGVRLMEEATANAEVAYHEKMTQAKTEIEHVIIEAKEQIKNERTAAFNALRGEIADLVTAATAKVAGSFDEKVHRQLIDTAIQDIERV